MNLLLVDITLLCAKDHIPYLGYFSCISLFSSLHTKNQRFPLENLGNLGAFR